MTIKHMKIFLEVYRSQNITRAARQLNMTQPAVSRAIKEIENYYGVCLFERTNRRLYITESARQFYAHSLHIIEAFDLMEIEMKNWDALGVIRVGSSITIGNYVLPQLVRRFQKQYPELKVKVLIESSGVLLKKIQDNDLDIALVEGALDHNSGFYTQLIGSDRIVLITSPNHELLENAAITLNDIIKYPILLREKGSSVRTLLDDFFTVNGLTLSPLWESTSTQAIVRAVSYGLGISLLPEELVYQDITDGIVATKEIQDVNLQSPYNLVWHQHKYLTNAIKNFVSLCCESKL